MSKIKLLLNVVTDLRALADSVQAVADVMEEPSLEHTPDDEPVLTLEAVRAVLAEKSRAGHTAQIRELLERHGATKLSEINPAEYKALLAEAEVLE